MQGDRALFGVGAVLAGPFHHVREPAGLRGGSGDEGLGGVGVVFDYVDKLAVSSRFGLLVEVPRSRRRW